MAEPAGACADAGATDAAMTAPTAAAATAGIVIEPESPMMVSLYLAASFPHDPGTDLDGSVFRH
jgi:hypothetical protein